jgi:hypothetical protein|tara:strand:- start:23850 stop:24158 length:309 start_codon:yes stop_codon:yes gene_type:complete
MDWLNNFNIWVEESFTFAGKKKIVKDRWRFFKKRAPKVPDYTCPIIDDVLDTLSSDPQMSAKLFRKIKTKMERLRRQNDKLRESGVYWYGICKKNLTDKNDD